MPLVAAILFAAAAVTAAPVASRAPLPPSLVAAAAQARAAAHVVGTTAAPAPLPPVSAELLQDPANRGLLKPDPFAPAGVPVPSEDDIVLNIGGRLRRGGPGSGVAPDGDWSGAATIQSLALYFGTWVAQTQVRAALAGRELELTDRSVVHVARTLRLDIDAFLTNTIPEPQQQSFSDFVTRSIRRGRPVAAGFYERRPDGDKNYDRVLPIVGVNTVPHSGGRNVSAVLFNELMSNATSRRVDTATAAERAAHGAGYNTIWRTRSQFLQVEIPTPPAIEYALTAPASFGFAVTGVTQGNPGELYRMMLLADGDREPLNTNADPYDRLILHAVVFGVTKGARYAILRFDGNGTDIPTQGFLALASQASDTRSFTAVRDGNHSVGFLDEVPSDVVRSYRCVLITPAPTPTPPEMSDGSLVVDRLPYALIVVVGCVAMMGATFLAAKRFKRNGRGAMPILDAENDASLYLGGGHHPQAAADGDYLPLNGGGNSNRQSSKNLGLGEVHHYAECPNGAPLGRASRTSDENHYGTVPMTETTRASSSTLSGKADLTQPLTAAVHSGGDSNGSR